MKRQEKEELRKKSLNELFSELERRKKALFEARMKHAQGRLKNTSLLCQLRKQIAIIKTFIRERKLAKEVGDEKQEEK